MFPLLSRDFPKKNAPEALEDLLRVHRGQAACHAGRGDGHKAHPGLLIVPGVALNADG